MFKLFKAKTPKAVIPAHRMAHATFTQSDRKAVKGWMNGIQNVAGKDMLATTK